MPRGPLFVGAYYRVGVVLPPKSKLKFDDLVFSVPAGAKGGIISPSRDALFNPQKPQVMLCIGYAPGTYILEARVASTNKLVAEAKFKVNALWRKEESGPPRWFTGDPQPYSAGAAWGGGPPGPENTNTIPATGKRRIAILLVDTSSQRYTTNATTLQNHRDRWMNEIINGVTQGGVTRSSRKYYQEVSFNNFDLSAQVFGPVHLTGTFDDYFKSDGTPKGTFFQACFTAGDSLIDYNKFDTLLCVSQSVTGPPMKSAWPYSSIGNWGPYTTGEGSKNYGVSSMPNEWGTTGNREIYETFSHELGHNLGMGDQYSPSVPGRNCGGWEMMDSDDPFPHFTIAHLMMLGWADPNWVEPFNFQSMAAPVDETVHLSPIEDGAPPAGHKAGIEIRLADGWNYYFEYREGQAIQIADRSLPTDNRVLGTDVVSAPYTPPISRPGILLLNNDVDGDGPVLGNGQDYRETDFSDPTYPTDFEVDVSGINGGAQADVRIRYGVNSKPDPSIRPWPAGPDRQWQSPDIEIRNARNQADPAWFNVPWAGNANQIVARIKNNGSLDAPQVRANFYVKDYNVGGTPETFLGTDVHDVPAGGAVDFLGNWTPPANSGHYCIVVRIPLYQLPSNPAVVEMTELNNIAQSNYDRFISATSIPTREMSQVKVGNPYHERTRIFINAGHSNPLYRTYLEHAWVYLDPGETKNVRVMYEYAPDQLTNDVYPPALRKKYRERQRVPNRVGFASFIEDPRDNPRHSKQILGGAQAEILTGRSTKFERFVARDGNAEGVIVTDDKKAVGGGKVIVRVRRSSAPSNGMHYQTVAVRKGGSFVVKLEGEGDRVQAFYIPAAGYAACESREEPLKK
jgi:M6 family metalloprotease-like protein